MGYRGFRLGKGLSLKAAADAIDDAGLRLATSCAFDEVGTVSSARGRQKANNDAVINSTDDVLGGVDGLAQLALGPPQTTTKYRFIKAGAQVYTNATTATALTDSTNLTAVISTSLSFLVNPIKGLSAPTWSATSMLSGFTYGGYTYLADGTTTQRVYSVGGTPPTLTKQTWGLRSPGYYEVTANSTSLSTDTGTPLTVTLTIAAGHGYGYGKFDDPSAQYPIAMNVEFVGFKTIGGLPENEINCLHYGGSGGGGDITVVSDGVGGGLLTGGATYTITYQNNAGAFNWTNANPLEASGGAYGNLTGGGSASVVNSVEGADDPATNEVQLLTFSGTVSGGYYRLRFARTGTSVKETTADIAYNATAAQVQAAILALDMFSGGLVSAGAASVTSNTAMTFPTTTAISNDSGGGAIGFIRQGPTLAVTANGGGLTGGTYYYAYTFFNGVAESNFSAQVPIVVSTNGAVVLTNVLMGPVGTTERRIYRTDVDARQLYYVAKIEDNTTLTYTDTALRASGSDHSAQPGIQVDYSENPQGTDDRQRGGRKASRRAIREAEVAAKAAKEKQRQKLSTNLGLLSDWTDHDPPPVTLKHVGLIGDTIFGIDVNTLRFSKAGEPEHFPLSNAITPGRNTSETLQAWAAFDRDCIMYTSNALYRLSQVGLSFEDSRFEEIESPVGLAGEWAVAALDGQQGHIFLAKSGLYLFDGARVNEVSYGIEPMFTDSSYANSFNLAGMSQAIMVTSRDRMFLSYRNASSGANDRLLIGDFQDPSSPNFTVIPWSFTSMWRERADNYVMAGDASGYLYVLDTGYTDDGAAIAWAATTKEFRLNGQTSVALDEIILDANFAGATTTITATMRSRGNTKTQEYTSTATGRQRLTFKLPVSFRGETIQVAVSSSHAGQRLWYECGFTSLAFQDQP